MGGGNLQKSQMARERNQAKMGKEGQGGGGKEGIAKRHADSGTFAAAQAERAAQKAAQEADRAKKAEKAAAAERCAQGSPVEWWGRRDPRLSTHRFARLARAAKRMGPN